MSERLEHLREEYPIGYLTVEQFLAGYLPGIRTLRTLRRHVDTGQLDLRLSQLGGLRSGRWVVYTPHLAEWLDRLEAAAQSRATTTKRHST